MSTLSRRKHVEGGKSVKDVSAGRVIRSDETYVYRLVPFTSEFVPGRGIPPIKRCQRRSWPIRTIYPPVLVELPVREALRAD
jgi:hypothetical protein